MPKLPIDSKIDHQLFRHSNRKHVLMITNHGIHQWQVIPGLRDTGGQNVFVNQFTAALARHGFKITIINRGGYPHPITGEERRGLTYKDEHQRILYLEDGTPEFVRKEDMNDQMPQLVQSLNQFLDDEACPPDLIISHYWDAARLGVLYNEGRAEPVKHIWVPHSLGEIKKRNVSEDRWDDLRIDERIQIERELLPKLDGVAATSDTIKDSLVNDYGCPTEPLFLPPNVETERYYPHKISRDDSVWNFVAEHSGLPPERIKACKIVTEISRTDTTKRKDVLIKAFAKAHKQIPDTFLLVSIDEHEPKLHAQLTGLIEELRIKDYVAVVGNVHHVLPKLYAITSVYCTPSIMEGFGMSVQEAAATKVPIVSSDKVPFATEYLLGDRGDVEQIRFDANVHPPLQKGAGAIVVEADDVAGFAYALSMLLSNADLRQDMGKRAYDITIPYFTWDRTVKDFLNDIGMSAN